MSRKIEENDFWPHCILEKQSSCLFVDKFSETCKMDSKASVDRISVLPENIIDLILTRLPIKEAVHTCILSQSWRFQWHFLSEVNINSNDLMGVSKVEFVKIVDHILFFHRGSVDKFKLDTDLDTHNDIDRWILQVSRNGIKELVIHNRADQNYLIPSCLFSSTDLTYLQLTNCLVKHPIAGKAFRNLTELFFCEVTIAENNLENVINSCQQLSRLSLERVEPPCSLKINAPKLVMFHLSSYIRHIHYMNAPQLESASFGLLPLYTSVNGGGWNIVKLLGSMPILQRLEIKYLALLRLPSICPIKHLRISINFLDLQELQAAFCLFRSSPFIQSMILVVYSDKCNSRICTDGFWKGKDDFSFEFDHLQTVNVFFVNGNEFELEFVKFLLSKAPVLKTMNVRFNHEAKSKMSTIAKLLRFPRMSPQAQLRLPTTQCQCCSFLSNAN